MDNTATTTEQQRSNSNNEVLLLSLEDNKYANLDESQLEEFAKIASPKVSNIHTTKSCNLCVFVHMICTFSLHLISVLLFYTNFCCIIIYLYYIFI